MINYPPRKIVWFSCGAASACAAKIITGHGPCEVVYCDTLKYEHPDNIRFFMDVEQWIGQNIIILKHPKYTDIMDLFRQKKYIVGTHGAPCTQTLKRDVRIAYSRPTDIHILGLTAEEQHRIDRWERWNSQIWAEWPLRDHGLKKQDCYNMLISAGIQLPEMYRLGYNNNNCIGCVKGGTRYWTKIRRDFPGRFSEMAKLERELSTKICKSKGQYIWLTDIPAILPDTHMEQEDNMECGILCGNAQ